METKVAMQSLLLVLSGFVFCYTANADIAHSFYSIETIVSDDTIETRYQTLPQALDLVILKVVGTTTTTLDHKELVEATEHIDKYVNSFAYSNENGFYILSVNFNQKMIDQLLIKMGMAAKLSLVPKAVNPNDGITLRVSGIKSVEDYARIMSYLKNLTVTKRVELSSVIDDGATFVIIADGGKDAVDSAIGPDGLLTFNALADKDLDGLSYKVKQ